MNKHGNYKYSKHTLNKFRIAKYGQLLVNVKNKTISGAAKRLEWTWKDFWIAQETNFLQTTKGKIIMSNNSTTKTEEKKFKIFLYEVVNFLFLLTFFLLDIFHFWALQWLHITNFMWMTFFQKWVKFIRVTGLKSKPKVSHFLRLLCC